MSDAVQIATALFALIGTMFSGYMAYLMAKLNVKQAAAAVEVREVKKSLTASDQQRDAQVGQLQGSVDTIHGKVDKIEGFVDGEHGVVLRALAAALAREAERPEATDQQKVAAENASQSSKTHDKRLAQFEAQERSDA